jgi:predicted RNase H-like HicB family nuclease
MEDTKKDNYFAVSLSDYDKVISRGNTMESVIEKADKTGEPYMIAPVMDKNITYIR